MDKLIEECRLKKERATRIKRINERIREINRQSELIKQGLELVNFDIGD